ncbi:MAG: glycosyltransferase family 2 protein [Candidatus Doudnabacteria bacterium]|nr:glycosyltransferase family 2 protein [Candidatus Doudnabacteria bacterium]
MTNPSTPPILSICIPTFSRSHFLRECLDSITAQFSDEAIRSVVEIAVSDNASTDDTEAVVKSYQKKYPNIRYSRNAENLGFDRNVAAALALGGGRFLWLMSDDEMLAPEALKFILPLLLGHPQVAYFCVNHGGLPRDTEFEVFSDGSAWLDSLGLTGGLISQNIYNRDFLPADISRYYGNYWIHYSLAFEVMAAHPAMLVKKLFLDPPQERECGWAEGGHALTVYNSLNAILKGLPALGYRPSAVRRRLRDMAKGLARQVASSKIHNLKISAAVFKKLCRDYGAYPWWLLPALAVYLCPNAWLRPLRGAVKAAGVI